MNEVNRDEIAEKVAVWLDLMPREDVIDALVNAWLQHEELTDLKKWHPFETAPTDGTIILGHSDGLFNGIPYVFSYKPAKINTNDSPWLIHNSTGSRPFTHCHQRWRRIPI